MYLESNNETSYFHVFDKYNKKHPEKYELKEACCSASKLISQKLIFSSYGQFYEKYPVHFFLNCDVMQFTSVDLQ